MDGGAPSGERPSTMLIFAGQRDWKCKNRDELETRRIHFPFRLSHPLTHSPSLSLSHTKHTYTYDSPQETSKMDDSKGLAIAFEEAKLSYAEGGIPVGPHPSPSEEEEDRARAGRKEEKKVPSVLTRQRRRRSAPPSSPRTASFSAAATTSACSSAPPSTTARRRPCTTQAACPRGRTWGAPCTRPSRPVTCAST